MHHNLLLVQSFTFSSAATPNPESGFRCRCSGRVHQCPRWRNLLPFCPIQRHSYSSPTSGRKEKSRWEKRQGHAFALGEERVEPLGFTFFMLVPRLGYGGLLTLLQSTVSFMCSKSCMMTMESCRSLEDKVVCSYFKTTPLHCSCVCVSETYEYR